MVRLDGYLSYFLLAVYPTPPPKRSPLDLLAQVEDRRAASEANIDQRCPLLNIRVISKTMRTVLEGTGE